MKISIMDYIKQKKILLAQDLIANGTKPTLAAQELGFEEYSTFFRLYKKYLGCSPSAHTPQ
jgi:AraC-like DNA-binding protein